MRQNIVLAVLALTVISSGCISSGGSKSVSTSAGVEVNILGSPDKIEVSNVKAEEATYLGTDAYRVSFNIENTGNDQISICARASSTGSEGAPIDSGVIEDAGLSSGEKKKINGYFETNTASIDVNLTSESSFDCR